MGSEEYREYLKSPEWAAMRRWALDRAGHACQVCNSKDHLDVHHRTYERLGHEWPSDLTVLCRDCHGLYHERMADLPTRPRAASRPRYLSPEARKLDRDIQELQAKIVKADTDDDKLALIQEKSRLCAELRKLEPNRWGAAAFRLPATGTEG